MIVLVVAHHAAMPYHLILPPFEPSSLSGYVASIQIVSPVNDEARSGLLTLFTSINDTFFMALLFFLSGLFVWKSLERKGNTAYLRDRLLRLGVPLLLMIALRPLTYYPTYLQNGGTGGVAAFLQEWSAIGWRGGPIWFLEVLLAFDLVLVGLAATGARALFERGVPDTADRPVAFYGRLLVASAVAYVPVSVVFTSFFWLQLGPAQVQVNRILFYGAYFLAGVLLGANGTSHTFLTPDSALARRWLRWSSAALASLVLSIGAAIGGVGEPFAAVFYVLAAATTSFAFLALFLRFVHRPRPVWDSLFESSYGIYVFHYGVAAWLSWSLLGVALPAVAKFAIVFPACLAISWAITALLRKLPGVARIL